MKKYSSFNQLIVRYLFTILAVVLLGTNSSILADTVWTAGDATVADLLTESNWSNGAPVTADNPGYINGDVITVSGDYKPGANGQNISLSFTGESLTNLTGTFVPVGNITSGNAVFTMRLEDSASVAVTGNNWVGTNNANNTLKPISGNDYVVSMYFTGSSKYTAFKEWWTAMSVKTLISIEDNATVSALAGNAGFSWCSNANGSLLNMTGGKLLVTADNFWIGDAENATRYGTATMNQSGGNASIARFLVGQAGSSYNLSNGVMDAGYMTVYAGSNANLTGGTLNLGMLSNEGTTTLAGATVNLATHSFINSTGTFNAQSGAINVKTVDGYSYSAGDQILVGRFADEATANAVKALTSVPSGWTIGVVDLSGTKAVIAQNGSAPTGVKTWTSGKTGILSDAANWAGETSNRVGYIVGGTNTFNDYAGTVVTLGGTNKFANEAVVHAGELLVVNGGNNTYGTGAMSMAGKLIVNRGSFGTSSDQNFRIYGTAASPAYMEVNGGTVKAGRWLAIGNANSTTLTAKVVVNNGIVQCGDANGGLIVCDGAGVNAELIMNGGRLQVNNNKETKIAANGDNAVGSFTMTNGYFTTGGVVNLATNAGSRGTLNISGGIFVASNTVSVATGNGAQGIINVSGGDVRVNNLKLGRKGAGDDAQLNLSGGIFEVTNGLYGSDSSASGNVYITGTGQLLMNSSYANADYAAIRELGKLYIEGSGDGSGALRFLQSSDSSVPITLTNDATIGIRTDAVFTQRASIESFNSGTKLTVKGGGTLELLKPAYYNGGTIIDSSAVKLSGTATLGTGNVTMTNGTLEFAYDDYKTFENPINGTGSLVKSGAGTTVLSTANSFTGNTVVKQGTLQLNDNAAAVYGSVLIDSEGVLDYNINSQSKTLNYSDDVNISGDGSFVKSGSGTLVLNGKHAYSGTTTVSGGVLQLTAQDAIANSSAVSLEGNIDMGAKQTFNNLSGYGNILNNGFDLTVNNTADTTLNGDITGSGSLTKTGTGTLKLASNVQYTGNTTVSEGTLVVGAYGSLASPLVTVTSGGVFQDGVNSIDSNIIVNGGSFIIGETPEAAWITVGNFALNNGGQISFDLNRYVDGATSQDDMDWLQAGTAAFNSGIVNLVFNDGEAAWYNNVTDNGYLLVTADSMSLDTSNVKVYVDSEESTSWGLRVVDNELFLVKAGGPAPVSEYWFANQSADLAEPIWMIDHNPKLGVKFISGLSQTAEYTGAVQMDEDGSFEIGEGKNLTLSGKISGSAAMDKIGEGTLTLNSTNDQFTGSTKVSAGTLALTAQNAISKSASVENNGAITMSAAQSLNNLCGTGTIDNGGSVLTLNNTAASEFSGVISGEGALVKTGNETLTLSGANDYTGATTINAGTLRLTGEGTIGTGALTNNAIIEFSPATGETMTIGYNVNNAAEASKTVKTGAGTLTTSAWINHNVEIKEGTLQITGGIGGNNGKRFNGTVTIDPGATLDCATHDSLGYGASNTVMNIYGTIDTSVGNETLKYTNFHFYGGTAKASGGGTYDICHTNSNFYSHALEGATAETPTVSTVSAGIRLRNSGEGDTFQIVTDANSQLNITGTIINYETQGVNCPIIKKGEGTLFLTQRNTFAGGLTIEAGRVISNAANASASTYGTGPIVVESGATLEFQQSNQLGYGASAPNDITIRGTWIPSNYTHIKNVTLEGGVIEKEYGYSDGGSGLDFGTRTGKVTSTGNSVVKARFNINSGATVTFDVQSDTLTVDGEIKSNGGFTKTGDGTMKLTAGNTYTGATNVNAGTLITTSSGTLASSSVNVASGATFVDGSNFITSAVNINGGTLTIGETSATARIVIGDFAVTNGTVNFDFNDASVAYNFDNLSTGAATLTSGIINVTFNNDDENTWWTNVTDSGYALINASAMTVDLNSFQLLVNAEESQQWYLDTADNALVLKKLGSEPPTPTDYYYQAQDDLDKDKWTIDGTDKKGVKFTSGDQNEVTYDKEVEMNASAPNGTIEVGDGKNLTLSGKVSGEGQMEKTGDGTLTLANTNDEFTGATKVSAGTLDLTKKNAISKSSSVENNAAITMGADQSLNNLSGNGTIDNGGNALTLNNTSATEFSGVISGDGSLTKSGTETLTLSGDNTYTGDTKVSAGTLALTAENAISNSSSVSVEENGKIAMGANQTFNNLSGNGTIDNGGNDLTLNNTADTLFSGVVSGNGNAIKTGDGKLKILSTDGQFAPKNFTVEAGELDFKGQYNGDLIVKAGSTLSPGNSVGDLTVYGNVIIETGATGLFEFSANDYDTLTIDGDINNSFKLENGSEILLDFEGDVNRWAEEGSIYQLVFGKVSVIDDDDPDWNSFLGNYKTEFALKSGDDGLGLYLVGLLAPGPGPEPGSGVPEPSTWALLILGALGLLYMRKRK